MAPSTSFFSINATTQAACDAFAEAVFGGPVAMEKPHGAYSYTLVARDRSVVIQFRESGSGSTLPAPDDPLFQAFVDAHPGLVLVHQYLGAVGTLSAYRMPKLPGVSFSDAHMAYHLQPSKWMVLAEDLLLCQFLSLRKAVHYIISHGRTGIQESCRRRLDHLYNTLPSRFQGTVKHVAEHLDDLFDPDSGCCPCVPVHGDWSKTNLFVDRDTGHLTGVLDLAEIDCLPFGFDLYAIDEMLGEWRPEKGWTEQHVDAAEVVRTHFWNTLLELTKLSDEAQRVVRLARLAGMLFHYGTRHDAGVFGGMLGTLGDAGIGLQILDVLIGRYGPS